MPGIAPGIKHFQIRSAVQRSGPHELHRLAAHVLAQRFERLGDDAFGIEAGLGVHGVGRVLVDEEIGQHHGPDFDATVECAVFGKATKLSGFVLTKLDGVSDCRNLNGGYALHCQRAPQAIVALVKHLEAQGNELVSLEIATPSLEDVFIELTGRRLRD